MGEPPIPRVMAELLRPQRLDEITGQREIVARLERLAQGVRSRRVVSPHLLFHGPPGIGKTTAARAFGRAVLGPDWEVSFNELRAHDNRSEEMLRNRIIPDSRRPPARGAPVRILFIDEVETLSEGALSVLRPALEGEDGHTVFILACNEIGRIPPPLRSRCTVFEFHPLERTEMDEVLVRALGRIDRELPPDRAAWIVREAGGVPRNAVKLLLEELA